MSPAKDPSVTDNARAEAERRYNGATLHSGLTYPAHALESHRRGAFVAGAEWAASRAVPSDHTTERVNALLARSRAAAEAKFGPADHTATTDDAAQRLLDTEWESSIRGPYRHTPDHYVPDCPLCRPDLRDNAQRIVRAVLATARPDTTTEWGVRFYGRGPFDVRCDSRAEAEAEVASVEDKHAPAVLITREVTPWIEAGR